MAKKVLIIDDDFNDLKAMKEALQKAKYVVQTATNGNNALDIIEKTKFDLILIDIKMPTLSGYELMTLLNEKGNPKTKTAYVTVMQKTDVNIEGVDGFLQKPIDFSTFAKQVKDIIDS